jgi:hypothetical protein
MHQVALLCFSLEVCHGSLKRLLQLLFIFLMLVAWCWGGDRWISNDDKSAFACNEWGLDNSRNVDAEDATDAKDDAREDAKDAKDDAKDAKD